MFIAKRDSGELFSVATRTDRNFLLKLRNKETFYCPGCKAKVILKLGTKRIFHFAHLRGSECVYQVEPESEYHLSGKWQLYKWLQKQQLDPILEPYEEKIKQRPDILFHYKNKTYVIEFQCSPINEQLFSKRTRQYLENGYIPIWILGAKQLNRKSTHLFSLSDFHSLFLTEQRNKQWTIKSYCPETENFIILQHITSVSTRNVVAKVNVTKIAEISIDEFLLQTMNRFSVHTMLAEWWDRMETHKRHYPLNRWAYRDPLLRELYEQGLSMPQLSPAIGLPLPSSMFIQTSPIIWQTYIYLDIFHCKNRGELIYLQDVYRNFQKRVTQKEITVRKLVFFKSGHYYDTIREYIHLLVQVSLLTELDRDTFKLTSDFPHPQQADSFFSLYQSKMSEQYWIDHYQRK